MAIYKKGSQHQDWQNQSQRNTNIEANSKTLNLIIYSLIGILLMFFGGAAFLKSLFETIQKPLDALEKTDEEKEFKDYEIDKDNLGSISFEALSNTYHSVYFEWLGHKYDSVIMDDLRSFNSDQLKQFSKTYGQKNYPYTWYGTKETLIQSLKMCLNGDHHQELDDIWRSKVINS